MAVVLRVGFFAVDSSVPVICEVQINSYISLIIIEANEYGKIRVALSFRGFSMVS